MKKVEYSRYMNLPVILRVVTLLLLAVIVIYSLCLFVMWTQLTRYKDFWLAQNQKAISGASVGYVALGDSAAQGVGATSAVNGYVGLVTKELSNRKGSQVGVINLSKSGAKVRHAIDEQLPALNKLNIDEKTVVTVEIGANDMIDFNSSKFESEMNELMDGLPKRALISDIPYFGGSRLKGRQSNVVEANKIMNRLAGNHGFKLVQLHDRMKQNDSLLTLAIDLFHPSNKAYRENWAPVFIDRL